MKSFLLSSVAMFRPEGEEGAAEQSTEATTTEQAAEGTDQTAAGEGGKDAAQAAEAAAAVGEAPAGMSEEEAEDWRDKEIRKKHRQIKERDDRIAHLERENGDLRTIAEKGGKLEVGPAATQEEIQRAAQQIVQQQTYQSQLSDINEKGTKTYGASWEKSLERLATFGTMDPNDMTAIMATDDPAKVLHEMGTNPKEFQRIMELPPARRQTEYVKISLKAPETKQVSKAPAPTNGIKQTVQPSADLSDKDSDDDWYRKREAQRQAKFAKRA